MICHIAEVTQLTASCQCLSNELVATCYTSNVNCLGVKLHKIALTSRLKISRINTNTAAGMQKKTPCFTDKKEEHSICQRRS